MPAAASARIPLGVEDLDETLAGGLAREGLHEVYADSLAELASATGFAAALASLTAGSRPILWIRQTYLDAETGWLHPSGLVDLGLDPSSIILVRVRDAKAAFKAGWEAARCRALGVVLIEPWSKKPTPQLSVSRRLVLAAQDSGVSIVTVMASPSVASAALTRWRVRPSPSRMLEARAPGAPSFEVSLLRNRSGVAEGTWRLEWDRDNKCFADRSAVRRTPLSRPVVSVPADGSAGDGSQIEWRKVG
ncbi:MAG: hypothetical protein IT548_17840 [Alphaproteobacteria bacterium]|nr:hypothetical protein [Alphaproteobacteria bacterium]